PISARTLRAPGKTPPVPGQAPVRTLRVPPPANFDPPTPSTQKAALSYSWQARPPAHSKARSPRKPSRKALSNLSCAACAAKGRLEQTQTGKAAAAALKPVAPRNRCAHKRRRVRRDLRHTKHRPPERPETATVAALERTQLGTRCSAPAR